MASKSMAHDTPRCDGLTRVEIAEALSFISSEDRETWYRMAMAVWDELGESGFEVWDTWSQSGTSYDARSARQVWKSARMAEKIRIGTLIFAAKANGWKHEAGGQELSVAELAKRQAERAARAKEAEKAHKAARSAAAKLANEIWDEAAPIEGNTHAYLQHKGVNAHDLRIGKWPQFDDDGKVRKWLSGALLVPMMSSAGKLVSLQALFGAAPAGWKSNKSYLRGGEKQGSFHMVGTPTTGRPVIFCEGYATGASIHEATGECVVVCFDAGNLLPVTEALASTMQGLSFVVAADDDRETRSGRIQNPGVHFATEAGRTINARVVVPEFVSLEGQPTDFNDLHQREGVIEVVRQLTPALRANDAHDFPAAANDTMPKAANENIATPSRDEARRERQKTENDQLQRATEMALPPALSLQRMEADCVWIAEGSMVGRISDPHQVLSFTDFLGLTAASVTMASGGDGKARPTPNAVLWKQALLRKTVSARTFRAGAGAICQDPDGKSALNSWRPIERWRTSTSVAPFLDQVEYLLSDPVERGAFLDWLAHLEQRPGELPHYGWLHIASHTGTGRNWLASVLSRVWRGYVAPNVDLPTLLDSQFNGQLAGRVLAIVDEVQEGAGDNPYRHTNRLKSLVNAEYRELNPKFGRQYREHNSCRWLVFSNHDNALPMNDTDRRWRVVRHDAQPRSADDYARLYAALGDVEFVNAVGVYLRSRDVATFNPGARPPMNEAKLAAVNASKSLVMRYAEQLVKQWPTDVITNADVAYVLSDGGEGGITTAMRRALEEMGAMNVGQTLNIRGKSSRGWLLRNRERWQNAAPSELASEAMRARTRELAHASALDVLGGNLVWRSTRV